MKKQVLAGAQIILRLPNKTLTPKDILLESICTSHSYLIVTIINGYNI